MAKAALARRVDKMTVILASGSPRRRELLRNICEDFTVLVPTVDEAAVAAPFSRSPRRMVMALSRAKALAVRQTESADAIIGADTVVALGRNVLGKPRTPQEGLDMLRALSGLP